MKPILGVVAVVLIAVPAVCEDVNPDVPFGGIAVEFFGGGSLSGSWRYDRSAPPHWPHAQDDQASFLPDTREANFNSRCFGLGLVAPLSSRSTVFVNVLEGERRHTSPKTRGTGWGEKVAEQAWSVEVRLRIYLFGRSE